MVTKVFGEVKFTYCLRFFWVLVASLQPHTYMQNPNKSATQENVVLIK